MQIYWPGISMPITELSAHKANHNKDRRRQGGYGVVPSTTKIVKWKQITTRIAVDKAATVLFLVRQR